MRKEQNSQNDNELNGRLVQYALSTTRTKEKTPCPSENDLTALIDGSMDEERRSNLFLHLDHCPDCYHEWLHLSMVKPSLLYRIKLNLMLHFTFFFRSGSKLFEKGNPETHSKQPWPLSFRLTTGKAWTTGLGVAMACMLLIFIQANTNPPSSDDFPISAIIENSCKEIQAFYHGAEPNDVISDDAPWQHSLKSYGFSPDVLDSKSAEEQFRHAFTAGVRSAKQQITGMKATYPGATSFRETHHAEEYELGRWCYLLRTAGLSNTTLSRKFWSSQSAVSEQYLKQFRKSIEELIQNRTNDSEQPPISSASVLPREFQEHLTIKIAKINQLLSDTDKHPLSRKAYRAIAREANDILDMIIMP